MILSDRTIRELLAAGRIGVEPLDESLIQPSSIDVRVANLFRVFRNHTAGVIDVKEDLTDLTELVEIPEDGVFMLHPGEFVLGSTLERIVVPDDLVARIEGKALAVTTPIPTPTGWSELGDLRVGDEVFDDRGGRVRIKDVSEVMLGRPCYELGFSDGATLVADRDHEWITTSRAERRRGAPPSRRTTAEIAATLRIGRAFNHRVHVAPGVWCPDADLPLDPYVLGSSLGAPAPSSAEAPMRIPALYRRASLEQRWRLLEGLVDAAGGRDDRGRCQLDSVDEELALDVHELAASLGLRPVIDKRPGIVDGVDQGPRHVVTFTPEHPVGQLQRDRAVTSARPVPSVPVRCIEVDDGHGVYLAGRSFVPTHNSSLGRLGLLIHSTAGFIDAGFDGHVTLELANVASLPITLYPGMKIGQISFMEMTTPADQPYGSAATGSKYQGQRGPTPSRYFENFR